MDFRASVAGHIAHLIFCTEKRRTGQCRPAQQADQGSHYTGDHFQRLLAEQGIMCRLIRVGVFVCGLCRDNGGKTRKFRDDKESLRHQRIELTGSGSGHAAVLHLAFADHMHRLNA